MISKYMYMYYNFLALSNSSFNQVGKKANDCRYRGSPVNRVFRICQYVQQLMKLWILDFLLMIQSQFFSLQLVNCGFTHIFVKIQKYPRRILNKNKTTSGQSTRESRSGYVKLSTLYIVGKQTLSTAWNVSNCVVKITVSK